MLFADFITEHEGLHFALEESILLPALPTDERSQSLAASVLTDHEYLRDVAQRLKADQLEPTTELTTVLGVRFRDHVRLEERELFPYIESVLEPEALARIGEQLAAAS